MFDLAAGDGSVRTKQAKSPIPAGTPRGVVHTSRGLDSPRMVDMHRRLTDYYTREKDRQYENRREMATDADFFDNIQWREEDVQVLRERGQMPLVYNVISASVEWVTGTERRARTDFNVLPRRKQEGRPAERKTQILKYLSDVNREPFEISRAFEDAVKVGIGWIEDGLQDADEDEPLYTRYESWRNVLWDSSAMQLDLQDARYLFRTKWTDLDLACAMFRKRKAILEQATDDADDFLGTDTMGDEVMDQPEMELDANGSRSADHLYGYQRHRVRLIEAWIRIPVPAKRLRGGAFSGEIFDEYSPGHVDSVASGEAEVVEKTAMQMHVAIFCSAGMLYFGPTPFRHNRFPMTPIWGYRRDRDGMPYGMIRRLKDIQEDVNKRASKALHILSTNKVIMEEGAVEDIDDFTEENARPDAVLVVKAGKKIELNADRELSQYQLELMSRSIAMIQQASGVTDELLGRKTNAQSGIAITRRQDQGQLATSRFFENLRLAKQIHGEKQLANVEQYMSEEKQFRITNMRGKPEYITVNDGLPENDIIRTKADYIISEGAWSATMREAQAAQLMETISRFPPEVGLVLLDLVVENLDLANREEIVKRIRSVTNQSDPDQEEPTAEEQQRMALQQQQAALAAAAAEAQVKKLMAEAAKLAAQVDQIRAQTVASNVSAQNSALGAAQQAIAIPAAVDVADFILGESGFKSRTDQELDAAAAASAAQMAQMPGLGAMSPPQA